MENRVESFYHYRKSYQLSSRKLNCNDCLFHGWSVLILEVNVAKGSICIWLNNYVDWVVFRILNVSFEICFELVVRHIELFDVDLLVVRIWDDQGLGNLLPVHQSVEIDRM